MIHNKFNSTLTVLIQTSRNQHVKKTIDEENTCKDEFRTIFNSSSMPTMSKLNFHQGWEGKHQFNAFSGGFAVHILLPTSLLSLFMWRELKSSAICQLVIKMYKTVIKNNSLESVLVDNFMARTDIFLLARFSISRPDHNIYKFQCFKASNHYCPSCNALLGTYRE